MNTLITSSLESQDVHLLLRFPEVLQSESERKITEWIRNYIARYSKPPTLSRLSSEFETFVPIISADPLGDIYEQCLTKKRNLYTREYLMSIQDELKRGVDPLPFIQGLHQNIIGGGGDVTLYTKFDRSSYHRKPASYPYGIQQIDQHTGGISAGDLIYLIGRLGTGKTTFTLWILSRWLQAGRRILMVSNENRADDVVAKIDSYLGGFNPLNKRTVGWSEDDLHRLSTVSFIASHMDGEVFIPNKPVQDTREVQNLIYTYRPDLVVVDGIYLMQGTGGESHWERITNVSRRLKQIAEGEGVPVLGVHQANRNAVGKRIEVEHVAYADALAQDADLLLALNPEDDGSIFVECIKNRWGKGNWGFFVQMFFETMTVKVSDPKHAIEEEE